MHWLSSSYATYKHSLCISISIRQDLFWHEPNLSILWSAESYREISTAHTYCFSGVVDERKSSEPVTMWSATTIHEAHIYQGLLG